MYSGTLEPNPVGNQIRGTSLYYTADTGHGDWGGCRRCILSLGRRRVCVRRDGVRRIGLRVATKLVFIGEAPGATEDRTGVPFTGHSGRILNEIMMHTTVAFHYTITNTVCCRPCDVVMEDYGYIDSPGKVEPGRILEFENHNRQPTSAEINHCRPHVLEIVDSVRPHGIVYLGKIASAHFDFHQPTLELHHPAFIARHETKLLLIKRQARLLSQFVEKLEN